ncbi:uncharacterized protein MELLADRAFT_49308 [Melampsora larici-populina 98AG31]|uniref:3-hydroxybutyryl-CoA dehydrogenase n=1 Tax=Melampsora larici-populina (strain 98AG31 / pathotype 3-4-7) TaxID=747676 RepID=F4RUC6_MELLP|nr:uncharacterized protein MELLADRAFT_49308 [Melampsora larici-populina 98AG31]EGG04022.1 hypothetical protein MELLADRAFT_49308 [Melampsora larici-populina 98AG31]
MVIAILHPMQRAFAITSLKISLCPMRCWKPHRGFHGTTVACNETSPIKTIAVIGAGQMGTGIALVAAKNARVKVLLSDHSAVARDKGLGFIDKLLEKDVSKQKITSEEAHQARERVKAVDDLSSVADVDLVIEAVAENLSMKQKIFSQLASICRPDTILASNTSSISLTKIAASAVDTRRESASDNNQSASRVIGLHFFNPVPVMTVVEVISALQTSPEVLDRARRFVEGCGKVVTVSQDTPGFISNRVLMPMINEAIICLEQGVATREDIDNTMKRGTNVPMGPLTLADFIGLDTCLSIMQVLHHESGDSKYRPSVLLGRMVDAGWLGKKNGRGFYDY